MNRPTWFQQAVIYELDVDVYQDSNGDGVGDFAGLTLRLDYLRDLGVDTLWLLPVFQTPNRDNGYDVTDFYALDERLGNEAEFREFLREAGARGLRVLLDLPLNGTSDEHPWFQASRDPHSPRRDWYVWRKDRPQVDHTNVFGGEVWTYDQRAGAYYQHNFYAFEPDLNYANGAVREEVGRVMRHWLACGVSGFRLDAVPFVIHQASFDQPYAVMRELHAAAHDASPDVALMGEVDVSLMKLRQYFGLGASADQLDMVLNFFLTNYAFLAFARKDPRPLIWALSMLPLPPVGGQWANFLRNHDELSLSRLSGPEREDVLRAFAPQEGMVAFGRGPRRRLAAMLGGDVRRIKLAYSLLLSLPGTPVLYYGDEIGMGDDLRLEGRDAVRTPMQWSPDPGGGFSGVPRDRMARPIIEEGEFGYGQVNVQAQQNDPQSLLCFVQRAIQARRACPELALGRWQVLEAHHPGVLAFAVDHGNRSLLALHNLTDGEAQVRLEVTGTYEEVLSDRAYDPPDPQRLILGPYGFRWCRQLPARGDAAPAGERR